MRVGHRAERGDEVRQVLARLERTDREHVGRPADDRAQLRWRLAPGAHRRHAPRHHDEPAGSDQSRTEEVVDLGGDELGRHVHDRAAPDRTPDDRKQRPHLGRAQLGVARERAVVDRDDHRQATRWREVVGRVQDAGGFEPEVELRCVAAAPAREQGPCGDGREPRVGWQLAAVLARPQAQRVGHERRRRLEVRERRDQLRDGVADAGAYADQRCHIDRDRDPHRPRRTTSAPSRRGCSVPRSLAGELDERVYQQAVEARGRRDRPARRRPEAASEATPTGVAGPRSSVPTRNRPRGTSSGGPPRSGRTSC